MTPPGEVPSRQTPPGGRPPDGALAAPPPEALRRVEAHLGVAVRGVRIPPGGYTPAGRFVLALADGRTVFAKTGRPDHPEVGGWLRRERWAYEHLTGGFLPEFLGFLEHPETPVLLLEDLSAARWVPPWRADDPRRVRDALDELHAQRIPTPPFQAELIRPLAGWGLIAADPAPFLGLGLAGGDWLDRHLDTLLAAEAEQAWEGESASHFDTRSDNLCVVSGAVKIFDWNHIQRANPEIDLGFWLPSLAAEGGPPPEELMPDAPAMAATTSGFFGARAGLPVIPHAPRVREIQRAQAVPAFAWAVRALGLPPPR